MLQAMHTTRDVGVRTAKADWVRDWDDLKSAAAGEQGIGASAMAPCIRLDAFMDEMRCVDSV